LKLTAKSSLADVAMAVGDALRRAGIRAVLTGGACADLYARGAAPSFDADFIVIGPCPAKDVDHALAPLGFERKHDRYVHHHLKFHVEFPGGQLGIGDDFSIRPVLRNKKGASTLVLSATDSCRDRLMHFYLYRDPQGLKAAVSIALRNGVAFTKVRAWSIAEGRADGYAVFMQELRRERLRKRLRAKQDLRSKRMRSRSKV
jgi:hypothetical protein